MTRFRALRDLKVATRITLGFGIAFGLLLVLAVIGLLSLRAVTQNVGTYSASAGAAQIAADVDIGMRDLEVAVRDHFGMDDEASLATVRQQHEALRARLAALAEATADTPDSAAVAETRTALDSYRDGFERLVSLRGERARLLTGVLDPMAEQMQGKLAQLREAGGVDSAALAADAAAAVQAMADHAARFASSRDPKEAEAMRAAVETVRGRLQEINRYVWVQGTRQLIFDTRHMLTASAGVLDRLEEVVNDEDQLRFQALDPNAGLISARAAEVRKRNDGFASSLRRGLAEGAERWVETALWLGGTLLVLGLLGAWLVVRSVARPVDAVAGAMAALAAGRTDAALVPAVAGRDELATMARAVETLRANAAEVEELKREAAEAHAGLLEAKQQAEAKDFAKTNFLVNMGQELHRPLNDIIHHSQSLMSELHRVGAGELATDVEMIQWSGEQLVGLVDAILDYAKIEAGTVDVELQDFDVARLLAELRERMLPVADLNGNTLTVLGAASLGAMHQDFGKVRQILLNLLDNACKFTRGGSIALSVERADRDGRACIRFTVSDTGAGFPPSQAGRLFQPFAQGPAPAGGKVPGAGLGLTLVGHYTAMLGGDLELSSEPGHGTRIILTLPAVYEPPAEDRPLIAKEGRDVRPLLTVAEPRALPQPAE
ncbi:ATP-binding protein [Azospirillum sp. TSO22-1]|uniref:sensor histidine kinase n=1 Tax=Azospirillum sp. TSO22-1 TaxID=716789 RepID=UPI0020004CF3|nr:ATP-binding protein [Azospirillum sp. TSO22-1]